MKIGYDGKRFFHNATGLGNYSRDLIRIMAKFIPENQYILYNTAVKKINRIAIDGTSIQEKLYSGLKLLSGFWRFSSIKKDLIKDQIKIYHGLSGEIPVGLKKTKIKSVVTIHDLIFVRYPKLYFILDRKIYFWKFKYAAKNADLVVAISEQTKKDIVLFLGIDENKIKVVYQGCASEFKEQSTQKQLDDTSKKYNLPSKFLLNVGTIESRKNILSVIKAINGTEIPLVVIGKKTSYFLEIEKYIFENKIENQIIFLESIPIKELSDIYKLATIFVYPSLFEGFGIPIIEALYSKTAVITSTGSCFEEAGGKSTIYVTPNEIDVLKKEILNLWNNKLLRKTQETDGYYFVQKFNDQEIAKNWNEIYKSL